MLTLQLKPFFFLKLLMHSVRGNRDTIPLISGSYSKLLSLKLLMHSVYGEVSFHL